MIRIGRESVGLDPTATTGDTVMLQKTQDEEVNSAVNLFTGREVLERAVEKVGADRILNETSSSSSTDRYADSVLSNVRAWFGDTLALLRLSDPGTEVDQAVRRLESSTRVSAPKQSTVITVRYTAATPQLAHDVVEALTSVFLEAHSRLGQSDGSLPFFVEQADKLLKDLTAAQEKLRDRKNEYQLTSAVSRRSILEQSKDALRQKVFELQLKENDMASRYTEDYPPLKELRRQRELAELALTAQPNTGLVTNESALQIAGGQPAANRARTKASPAVHQVAVPMTDQQGKLNAELMTLNDQELELAQLDREVNLLEGKYAMHVEKLEQARVNDALSRERITNVKIAQPASLVHKPVSPKKQILLAGGLALALLGSLGAAFASDKLDQTLRTTAQVEQQLGLPVLASLPYRRRNGKHQIRIKGNSTAAATSAKASSAPNNTFRSGNYQGLIASLRSLGGNNSGGVKTIGVVGCDTSNVPSRIAGNLALEAANSGTEPVLLIDGDARRRRISQRFHLNGDPGWIDVLSGRATAKNCVKQSSSANLAVLGPGGTNGAGSAADLSTDVVAQLDSMKSDYGLVVVDLPQTGERSGVPVAAEWIDEAVLVVESERTRIQAAQRARDALQRAGIQVAGVVITNRRDYIPRWLYQRL